MGRWILLTAVLIGAWSPWALAQVAVPELAPIGVRLYSTRSAAAPTINVAPENPAAMQYGTPSRIGGGGIVGNLSDSTFGQSSKHQGTVGGFRLVGHGMAFAAESMDLIVDLPGVAPAPAAQVSKRQRAVAVSFPVTDWLAWGLSRDVLSIESSTGAPGYVSTRLDSSGWTLGLSGHWGEHFFYGAAAGNDVATALLPGPQVRVERGRSMYGIGLRGAGALVWRLEVDGFQRDDYKDALGNIAEPGYQLTQYSAEVLLWNLVVAYTGYAMNDAHGPGSRTKGSTWDLGLAPLTGITITTRIERSDTTTATGETQAESVKTIGASWQF